MYLISTYIKTTAYLTMHELVKHLGILLQYTAMFLSSWSVGGTSRDREEDCWNKHSHSVSQTVNMIWRLSQSKLH